MSRGILALWRERWGKGDDGLPDRPFLRGKLHQAAHRLVRGSFWDLPFSGVFSTLLVLLLCAALGLVNFTFNGQITFAGLVIAIALVCRRMEGRLFALIMIYLTLVSATQYLQWRLTQTLVYRSSLELFLSLALCALEMCIALQVLARSVRHLWPLAIALPEGRSDGQGPDLTLIHDIGELDDARALEAMRQSGLALPHTAFEGQIILDHRERPLLRTAASLAGARYLSTQALAAQDGSGSVLAHLAELAAGEWLLFHRSTAERCLSPEILATLTQSLQAEGPVMLYTQDHPIAFNRVGAGRSIAATRATLARALRDQSIQLEESTSLPPLFMVSRPTLKNAPALDSRVGARFLRALRQRSAMIAARADTGEAAACAARLLRIDRADSNHQLRGKCWTHALVRMLDFYRPPVALALLLLPLLPLLGDLQLVQMRGEWLSVMVLPCVVLLCCLDQRIGKRRRWGMFKAMRETLLNAYIATRTAWCFVHESLRHAARALQRSFVPQPALNPAPGSVLRYLLIILNGLAFLKGLQVLLQALALDALGFQPGRLTVMVLFMLLALRNAVSLLAQQALMHERGHIHAFLEKSVRQSVTLITPQGRTLRCQTRNYPALPLQLSVAEAGSTALGPAGQEWHRACQPVSGTARPDAFLMQFEQAGQIHSLQVRPQARSDALLQLDIDEASLPLWHSLEGAVMARDAHWPAWLAPENADQILPRWFSDWLNQLPARAIDLLSRIPGWLQIATWVALIKNKN